MSLSGLQATSEYSPEARYRGRDRRLPDRPAKPEADAPPAPLETPVASADGAFFASRFKADLTQLTAFEGAGDFEHSATPHEVDPTLVDFFGNLSVLLVAVRAGDIMRAQAAADALELDALVEHNGAKRPGGSAPLLGDLVALLSAAQSRDEGAARYAARDLAGDVQSALGSVPFAPRDAYAEDEPEPAGDGADAYDTLRGFLAGDPGAV